MVGVSYRHLAFQDVVLMVVGALVYSTPIRSFVSRGRPRAIL
jgi:uncharacterized membrane protein